MSSTNNPVSRSGRFEAGPEAEVARFTESISFDRRLWQQDILGSIAHAHGLCRAKLITRKELKEIEAGLQAIGDEIESGAFEWKSELEDVHMNIESELTRRTPAGAKLHTGRSRNDQVALDMRLWLRDEIFALGEELRNLQRAITSLGEKYTAVILPGYTHLQRAQPVYFAHHMLAYVEMIDRDLGRLLGCLARVNVCPLGSGAIAGTTLPLDREFVAEMLGFVDMDGRPRISQNSMDAVSDRDFAIEFCFAASLMGVHLSRLAEDLILWTSAEFGFARFDDAYTTGSSLMPQKKNPDLAELTRGKSARLIGNLMALLTLLKGLPMTYNRDLQEDKERLFDSADHIRATVRIVTALLEHTHINTAACQAAAGDPALLATDLADYLVNKGMPFRQAHHKVGQAVAMAEKKGVTLKQLSLEDYRSIDPLFGSDTHQVFDLEKAMRRRTLPGSPGTQETARQLKEWKASLDLRKAGITGKKGARRAKRR